MSAPFADFAACMERIRQARGPRCMALWEVYCDSLDAADRDIATDFREGQFHDRLPWTSLRIPKAGLLSLLSQLSGWDDEVIGWVIKSEGTLPSAYRALLPDRDDDPRLTLAQVASSCLEIATLKGDRRLPVLAELIGHASPQSAKVLLQLLTRTLPLEPMRPISDSPPVATCCVVIIAATADHAERTTLLSDYTIAVRDGDRFASVGTVWEGLEAREVETISKLLQSIPGEQRGDALLVDPRIVLEVSCTGVRENRRRQSGLELTDPRILRWRTDVLPEDVDALALIQALAGRPAIHQETIGEQHEATTITME